MSNKLYKRKPPKKLKKFHYILLIVFILVFIVSWVDVFITSARFEKQLDSMVEGIDYYIEDVQIIKKKSEYLSSNNSVGTSVGHTTYYFYYDFQSPKKMFVDREAYQKYNKGDYMPAYTLDHVNYGYTKDTLLPHDRYLRNEMEKAFGCVLGIFIFCQAFWMWDIYSTYKKFERS